MGNNHTHEGSEGGQNDKLVRKSEGDPSVDSAGAKVHGKVEANINPQSGFTRYQSRGGTLTTAEYKLVFDTPSTSKGGYRQRAEGLGLSSQVQEVIAVSLMVALKGDSRAADDEWVRAEAKALVNADSTDTKNAEPANAEVKLSGEMAKDFSEYQAHRGIMNAAEYKVVLEHRYSHDDYSAAMEFLMPFGLPDNAQVEMTARLMGAMKGNPKFANAMLFVPEMYILMKQY